MRVYFAVIKDSFREALASRVLWILLVLITLILAALAPFGLSTQAASTLERRELQNGYELLQEMVKQDAPGEHSPRARLRSLLSGNLKERIKNVSSEDLGGQRGALSNLVDELNALLDRRDLYDEDSWKSSPLGDEAKEYLKRGTDNLSEVELRRFNRLLVDVALRDYLTPAAQAALHMSYFGWEFGPELPFGPAQTATIVKSVMATLISYMAGVIGVFVAILVTASIVPQMFEPGAIDLLLSKPVSRSLLFLTKFAGACAFILLNAAYLIVGLWLILGLRFDIWSGRLLLCIPVLLFLFIIYYSISALAGVVWRNAVVSVIITVLFWFACFSVGTTKAIVETAFLNGTRLATILPADDKLLVVNKARQTFEWDAALGQWREVFLGRPADFQQIMMPNNVIGPVYDAHAKRIIAVETTPARFELLNGPGKLLVGQQSANWLRTQGAAAPNGVGAIFVDPAGTLITAGSSGIHRFEGDPTAEHVPFMVFGRDLGRSKGEGKFVEIGPSRDRSWNRPFAAALTSDARAMTVFTQGKLLQLRRGDDGKFQSGPTRDLETKDAALVGCSDKTLLVALESGEIRTFAVDTLEPLQTFQPFGKEKPRLVAASPNGRWFAVVYHDRRLWLFDAERNQPLDLPIRGRKDTSSVTFTPQNHLLVADRFTRVTEYQLDPFQITQSIQPPPDTLELAYRFAINPIYTVFPKPGELDNLVNYLLTEQKTVQIDRGRSGVTDLRSEQIVVNVWQPAWSSLAFVAVILGCTCFYISRRDF